MDGGEARFGLLDPALLADPVVFLRAEHARQRALLAHLERVARHDEGPTRGALARALAAWLACEMPLHLRDERESLFPRLPEAEAPFLADISAEAARLDAARVLLRADLARISMGHRPAPGFAERALDFVAAYRRHLAREDAELLPAAERSLSAGACTAIAIEMAARRS
jgi:hemerythrin-like domain-containing protein